MLSTTSLTRTSIGGKGPNFSANSGLLVKVHVQASFREKTSGLKSPAKIRKHGLGMMTKQPQPQQERKILVKQFCALNSTHLTDAARITANDGRLVQDGLVYTQNILVRSFEIGGDGKMSFAALTNHLQDTALNQGRITGLVADGFGSTKEMSRNNLIWVVCSMHMLVDRRPSWADVVEVDTWMYASGKNGLGRDWLFRHSKTGEILARATSVCVIMNKKTRKLCKFTEEIREEIAPSFVDCDGPILDKNGTKIPKLDFNTADHVCTGLMPAWKDMDINQHVSHVKYIDWILDSVPRSFMENYELTALTLEYRKECDMDSVLQSLSKIVRNGTDHPSSDRNEVIEFDHLLCLENGSEILRGRTVWKPEDHANKSSNNIVVLNTRDGHSIIDKRISWLKNST